MAELAQDGRPDDNLRQAEVDLDAIHVGTVDPGAPPIRIPFCARNTFGGLRARTADGMVPRALAGRS